MDVSFRPLPSAPPAGYYPREVAAHVTLRAAAAVLVAPPHVPFRDGDARAVTTACAALVTRVALLDHLAASAVDVAAGTVPPPTPAPLAALPERMQGRGAPPDRERLVLAGDRCVEAWRRWSREPGAGDYRQGVAGALALAAWCSWALGSAARARTRASYARGVDPTDPLTAMVERWCRAKAGPPWWRGGSRGHGADGGPTVG